MKTSTWILLGIGGYLLYRALNTTQTVTIPNANTALLTAGNTPAAAAAQAVNQMINAGLVAAGNTPGIV